MDDRDLDGKLYSTHIMKHCNVLKTSQNWQSQREETRLNPNMLVMFNVNVLKT